MVSFLVYINPPSLSPLPSLSYGEGSGKVLFVEDHCTGDEDTFLACPLERRHPGGCNHDYDVGLICGECPLYDLT